MKQFYLTLIILTFASVAFGQQFSFPIYFQDAIGNKDTIILGYDINATDTIDVAFGETNIISVPLDTALDVRITDEWWKRNFYFTNGTFHTKKQIVKNNCGGWFSISDIDIYTKHWPVTASWDSLLFFDTCRNGSVFTSVNPGGWWDTGSPSDLWRAELKDTNQVIFTSNTSGGYNINYGYVNGSGDTIPVFWQAFGDSTLLLMGVFEIIDLEIFQIYPNPTTSILTFENHTKSKISSVQFFDFSGRLIQLPIINNVINISKLDNGIYLVQIMFSDGQKLNRKVIKINAR